MAKLIETLMLDPKKVWVNPEVRTRAAAPKGDALKAMVLSIQDAGQLQPIGVMLVPADDKEKAGDADFQLIYGEHRLMACAELGMDVRADVYEVDDEGDFIKLQFMENDDRKELTPVDTMNAVCLLVDGRGLKQKDVSAILGLNKSDVSDFYSLKDLPERAKKMLGTGQLNRFQGKALLDVAEGKRDRILEAIASGEKQWTANQLKEYSKVHPVDPALKPAKKKKKKEKAGGTRKIPAVLEALNNTIKAGDEVCEVKVPIGELANVLLNYIKGDPELNMTNLFGALATKYAKKAAK